MSNLQEGTGSGGQHSAAGTAGAGGATGPGAAAGTGAGTGAQAGAFRTARDEILAHDYDGIREYDNPPPNWIMAILYASLIFAVGYWTFYHVFDLGSLPVKEYQAEAARAAANQLARMAGQEPTDESLALMAQTPAGTAEGAQIFQQFCVACHAADGSGSVGPNLTDPYWLHGGRPTQILATVTNGVPDKGMVAWAGQLGPARVQKVVAYVLTLKGKNLPGKAPQGEPETSAAPAGSAPVVSPPDSAAAGPSRSPSSPSASSPQPAGA